MKLLQLFINNQEVDLAPDFSLPVSYSVNEIGDVASRESALSTEIQLPKTARNTHIFSGNAYKVLPCEIRELGCLITKGTAEIESSNETYNVYITAGNDSFFRNLDGINLKDLKFYSQSNHIYSIDSVETSQQHSWQNVYTYPLANPGSISQRQTEAGISLLEIFPALYVKRLFMDLIGSLGYYATGEFLEDALFSSCLVDNGNPLRYSNEQLERFKLVAAIQPDSVISASQSGLGSADVFEGYLNFNFTGEAFGYNFSDKGNNFDPIASTYTAPADMLLKAKVELPFKGVIDGIVGTLLIEAQLEINGVVVQKKGKEYPGRFLATLGKKRYKLHTSEFAPVQVKEGDTVRIKYLIKKTAILTDYSIQILLGNDSQLTIEAEPYILPGFVMDVNSLLPDMEAKDFLLALANQFCLLFIADERTRSIRVEKFQKVVSNIPKSENWSKKLDFSEAPEETFESDNYGQKSIFKYGETDGYTGEGYLKLLNQKLEKEKTVFESKFAASPKIVSFDDGTELLSIARYQLAENTRFSPWAETETYQSSPGLDYVVYKGRYFKSKINENANNQPVLPNPFFPTITVVNNKWEEVSITEVLEKLGENQAGARIFHLAKSKEPVSVSWLNETTQVRSYAAFDLLDFSALVNTYYAGLGTALYSARYLKVLMHLKPSDIQYLDFVRPKLPLFQPCQVWSDCDRVLVRLKH